MPIRCTRDASDELSRVAHAVARQYRQGVQKRKLVSHLSVIVIMIIVVVVVAMIIIRMIIINSNKNKNT